ncbi:Dcp1p-Dcp2p decapping enzyme complex alpha subunit [Tilletia horrida]|nr:Dcp1p-Dcp2p decapping enzyme complex alpha subunit [Tilletia horrida]
MATAMAGVYASRPGYPSADGSAGGSGAGGGSSSSSIHAQHRPPHASFPQQQHQAPLVPDVPGDLVRDPIIREALRAQVAELCGLPPTHQRFVGSQPVSFDKHSLDILRAQDYWVCEKSDGQRVLVLVTVNIHTGMQEVFLIDRKNEFRYIPGLQFPSHKPKEWHTHSLLDGELVLDLDPNTGKHYLVLLLFDCIVLDQENLSKRPLVKRYGRLQQFFHAPYERFCRENEAFRRNQPFKIQVKKMELSYGVVDVLLNHIPNLKHGNDGLIFTCANDPYVFGTDPKILKWKPPSENSIDFRVRLRFPPDLEADPEGTQPDFTAKPFFMLEQHMGDSRRGGGGGEDYEFFDWMEMDDDEWEDFKRTGEQLDDRIVEVVWETTYPTEDSANGHHPLHNGAGGGSTSARRRHPPRWKFKRIRDDKKDGNHYTIVRKILSSIEDGVEQDELVAAQTSIKAAWKTPERAKMREAASITTTTSSTNQHQHPGGGGGHQHQHQHQHPHGRSVSRSHSSGGAMLAGSAAEEPTPEHPCPLGRPGPPPPLRLGARGVPPMMTAVRRR